MTRFEAYLNAWTALGAVSNREPDDFYLAKLVDDMNPYWYGSEDSKDIYIYQRYSELWITEGTTYTPSDDNLGFTFAKTFFAQLPKTDERFEAGRRALARITQEEWQDAAFQNATIGTYMLAYHLLSGLDNMSADDRDFLSGMDPFSEEENGGLSADNPLFYSFWMLSLGGQPRYELSFDLALSFLSSQGRGSLEMALRRIGRDEWDSVRTDDPLSFRVRAEG